MAKTATVEILTNQTSTTTLANVVAHQPTSQYRTFQASGFTSSGAGAATIDIRVSNDGSDYSTVLGTITLTLGTTVVSDGFGSILPWRYVKPHVTAISGTGASVTVTMGTEDRR